MLRYIQFGIMAAILVLTQSCSQEINPVIRVKMDDVAEGYVKLVLNVGLYDQDYVDAYFGPEEWRPAEGERQPAFPYDTLVQQAQALLSTLRSIDTELLPSLHRQRQVFLEKHLESTLAKIEMLNGKEFSFDEESQLLYNAVAPQLEDSYFQKIITELKSLIPEGENIDDLLAQYRKQFTIPPAKLDTVFAVAIEKCRTRSNQFIEFPQGENFHMEFVNDKSWGAYNWYKGNLFSLIEVNTDRPMTIQRALGLVAHEGYPGHHVFQILREKELVEKNGFIENTIFPLHAPVALIAEGTAVYGEDLVFALHEKYKIEQEELFPLAGLDTTGLAHYRRISELREQLGYGSTQAARLYLDGQLTKEQTIDWLVKNTLSTPKRAAQSLRFIEQYRSYIINYSLGRDLVQNYIESQGGTPDNPELQWQLLKELLKSQVVPGDLVGAAK